ncbi:hypothetical protein FB451DRAFT_653001 [Mycena latifolia]|nr:hypothetical protein FB451DRAFT_653001 [Mycena latifolia]
MDANFTFPSRPRPTPRPTAGQAPTEPANRQSNALRASVLDAALELGFGANGTVANWMFNNALEEADEEDEDPIGRGPLSATSDEYAPYSTPPTSTSSHSESFHPPIASPVTSPDPNTVTTPQVHFPPMPAAVIPAPAPSNKLRKARRDDGYESDGGYVSEGGKKGRARTKSKTAKDSGPTSAPPISEPMELIPLTKEERKRRKKAGKASKDLETDTEDVGKPAKSKSPTKPKKSKKSSTDAAAGYETDDGYVSSSGKPKSKGRSRFFSLRRKADSTSEPAEVEPVPPMPEREVFPLPIASRFATTLGSSSTAPSRAASPLPPPSRPFASSASGSSTPSLLSSANSLLTSSDYDSFGTGSPQINTGGLRPFADDESLRGHTPDKSFNSTLTVTQDQVSSRSLSPQPPNSKSKFLISYPLTRTPSPGSPTSAPARNASSAKPRHVPSPISLSPQDAQNYGQSSGLNSRAPSPSPFGSPFVLLTPINTSISPRAASPAPSNYTDNIVPSADFLVPSRSGSPLPPSPSVLAYYDIPPPSPPPNGPLPRAPRAPPSAARDPTPGVSRLRSLSQDRAGRHLDAGGPLSGHASPRPVSPGGAMSPGVGGVQRGRASPFPSHPVLPARAPPAGVGPGLAARAKVQRYRDLYAIQIPPTPVGARAPPSPLPPDDEVDIRVEEWDSEGEGEEILGVLGRFRSPAREQGERPARALERNNSGALRRGTVRDQNQLYPEAAGDAYSDDDEASRYPDEEKTAGRSTMYRFDNGSSGGDRDTLRWSESRDSRASFLDLEKSEQARGMLVERVGVMFDLSGRERSAIPPVPKLPAGLVTAGVGNRF